MSAITIVRAVLQLEPDVAAVVGERIFPVELPQAIKLPAIVLHLVREADGRHLAGHDRYPLAELIVDSIGEEYADADELGEVVKIHLRDFVGAAGGYEVDDIAVDDLDFFDRGERGNIWRRRQGFSMRYRAQI